MKRASVCRANQALSNGTTPTLLRLFYMKLWSIMYSSKSCLWRDFTDTANFKEVWFWKIRKTAWEWFWPQVLIFSKYATRANHMTDKRVRVVTHSELQGHKWSVVGQKTCFLKISLIEQQNFKIWYKIQRVHERVWFILCISKIKKTNALAFLGV